MTKALLCGQSSTADVLASGDELNVFGYGGNFSSGLPLLVDVPCGEAVTFSKLGANVISGGSGTNNFQFRKNQTNGNQLATGAGAILIEDLAKVDHLSAGDQFSVAYTDTGTDSTTSFFKMNMETREGHGCIYAALGGAQVFDAASATRFMNMFGAVAADGTATEDNVGWKVRGDSYWGSMYIYVSANARLNDSVFRNRIAKGNGTGIITIATTLTGVFEHREINDSIADGQVINIAITLDTGVEDLTIANHGGLIKSRLQQSDVCCGSSAGVARTASSTANYLPLGGVIVFNAITEAQARVRPGFKGTASNLRCYVAANTYTGDATLKLYKNGTAVITTTITAAAQNQWFENSTDSISFNETDGLSFEIDEGTSNSATFHMIGCTLRDDANIRPTRYIGMRGLAGRVT